MKIALITGQDGSLLVEFLFHQGCEVYGIIKRSSSGNTLRFNRLYLDSPGNFREPHLFLRYGDLSSTESLINTLIEDQPNEINNSAAQSYLSVSFNMPVYTGDIDPLGVL